jgi:7,8-dihydropterin-6-yl-methyl-4-(beta-D-ribofuranosyl)aminobenzene 5'-phosphate synthase
MVEALTPIDMAEVIVLVDNGVDFSGGIHVSEAISPRVWAKGANTDHLRGGHGLSLLVRTYVGEEVHEVLYDTGPSDDLLEHNVRSLGLDLTSIEAIVMSHGHWDHFGGIKWALKEIAKPSLPVYMHPRMLAPRRILQETEKGPSIWKLPDIAGEEDIVKWGGEPIITDSPTLVASGTILRTGEIPRQTTYEKGIPGHQALVGGSWQDDASITDDNSLVLHVKGKGLVVLTGCAHAGVVNSVREAVRLTGTREVHALIGGIHLMGHADMTETKETVDDLTEIDPHVVACGHCTGWRAQHALSAQFGKRYVQSGVGIMFRF